MAKKYTKKYDKKKKEYVFFLNGKEDFRVFKAGYGGQDEWTGISKYGGFGYTSFKVAVLDMMGWNRFKEYMKGRKRA